MIHLLDSRATPQQLQDMLEVYSLMVKIVVIRPRLGNRSMVIQSDDIRSKVSEITQELLGGIS